jgi:Family of unknown function (DUF6079)
MQIKDVFANDVTRDIAPVIYFHEQDPAKVTEEVSEYIVTGGYPETDPRSKIGIHEQFVKLLSGLAAELQKAGGVELPAAWISGFYGSGKSSFAKLLGLALDGLILPDGQAIAEVLLKRDESPKSSEFRAAWTKVRSLVQPIAVIFDIGAVARDDEQIHAAVKREIQKRLGYCSTSNYVADYELNLELEGLWPEFEVSAQGLLGRAWAEAKDSRMAEEEFSQVMHAMNPSRYTDPLSWFESRAGANTGEGSSVDETIKAIAEMLRLRAVGKTLFVVVDEVSQYIYQNNTRMLKLQSFVSALGQKLKGQVWLLATGQQQLEDSDDESSIGKLKDRFPPKLRVHLAPTNIRDVVHKRLLKKLPTQEGALREIFQQYRSDLKLYGYQCQTISEEDFVEVYPMLPGYVDLLMQITSNLRLRSSRAKGDDHAIRGLLQLLGDLFRERKLGARPLGDLITLEDIFEVQQSSLDNDMQTTLTRIFGQDEVLQDALLGRVAKIVSLLELIQEQEPTTVALVSQCLYERLGQGNQEGRISQALEQLRELNLLSYSEKTGYKLQSSAGQEWARERDGYSIIPTESSAIVADKLKDLLGGVGNPGYKGKKFRWAAYYSDGRQRQTDRLQVPNDLAAMAIDFQYLKTQDEKTAATWIQTSDTANFRDRLIWVVGKLDDLDSLLRDLAKSRHIINKYQGRSASISVDKKRMLFDEQSRCEGLETKVKDGVVRAFLDGALYFRGRQMEVKNFGNGFAVVLEKVGESILPELFDRYFDVAIIPSELKQLLEKDLTGPSTKFMQDGLGILELDAGKYNPTCAGEVPARIGQYVLAENGVSGQVLLNFFGGPPYGYAPDVVKACLAGLFRASKIQIRLEDGTSVTSIRDPGVMDLFTKDRDFKRADILPPSDRGITSRDRIAICTLFKDALGIDLDREDDTIADAVFKQFPNQVRRLRELEQRYNKLPNRLDLPTSLAKLQSALEKCLKSRQVEPTLLEVKRNLDVLRDGVQQLGILETDLTDDAIAAVSRAGNIQQHQVAQLEQVGAATEVQAEIEVVAEQLKIDRPWRDIASLEPQLQKIESHYTIVRRSLLERQEQQAEAIRHKVKQRSGYARLSPDKATYVLRPVTDATYDTTAEALYPPLLVLKDSAVLGLQMAEEQANRYLDDALSQATDKQVMTIAIELSGREVSSPEEVEVLVNQLRDRLLSQLDGKSNIRIRLI